MNIHDFRKMKLESRKITMVTCYDYSSARIVEESSVDCVLVGDSVAMTMHGHSSTLGATIEMMRFHVQAVARGLKTKFLVADMPFLSFRKGIAPAMDCVRELMAAGAHSVKLEGVWGHEEVIEQIVRSGVPVMGHIGLTPQSVHGLGGWKVQGRDEKVAQDLQRQAKRLEELGCFALVLECVPSELASMITRDLSIPTIGIGAGSGVDGQVLVYQDVLGMNRDFKPRFVRRYLQGDEQLINALNGFQKDVLEGAFPGPEESFS